MLPKIPQPFLKRLPIAAVKEAIAFFFQRMGNSQSFGEGEHLRKFDALPGAEFLLAAEQHADNQVRRKASELVAAKKEVLSYERIIQIAENIYERGGIKRLRERERKLAKNEEYLARDREALANDERAFVTKPIPSGHELFGTQRAAYEREKQELADRRKELSERSRQLADERKECMRLRDEIDVRRDTPEAERKIQQIAVGIMRKNWSAVMNVKKIAAELEALQQNCDADDARVSAVDAERDKRGGSARYKSNAKGGQSGGSPIDDARAIADYLRSAPTTQLIAKDRDDRMDENWTLMSAFEKDEIAEESSRGR